MLGTVCCSYGWGGLSPGPLLGTEGSGDVGSPFLCASLRCRCSVQSAYVLKSAYTLVYDTLTCQFTVWHTDLLSSVCRTDGSYSHGGIMYVCYSDLSAEMMERPVSWGGLVYEGALILKNTPLSLHQISLCPALHPSPFLHLSGCFSFKLCTNLKFKEIIHSKKCCCFFVFVFNTFSKCMFKVNEYFVLAL